MRQQADLGAIGYYGLDKDIVARSAVENVLPGAADQHVVTRPTQQSVVAWAADEDVIAVAAVGRELNAASVPTHR